MECWSFPAAYDEDYLPSPESPYWFPVRETMDPGERERAIVARVRDVMHYARERSPFYRRKWDDAGIHPDQITSLEAFERVPVVTKEELRTAQVRQPPFGDYLCIPETDVAHIHGTSGTTGQPVAFGIGRADWQAVANSHARVIWSMGLRPGDTVFVAALFSLFMGSWGSLLGAERLRCKVLPFGAGAPGMTARAAQWLLLMRPRGFFSTPSYALRLAEVADEEGIDPRDFGLEIMFCAGEPGGSIPAVRRRIEETFGARVFDCGTMSEMTPFMSAAATAGGSGGMVLWQDIVYHEICDPNTFARVPYGQRGSPVYTHLERTSQPMIRLLSNDLSHWVDGPSPCGRTYPYLPDGVYGRIDDMFQIRGENVYPSAIDSVLTGIDGYGGEHQIVITRERAMDELLVRAEMNEQTQVAGEDAISALGHRIERSLMTALGVRTRVEVLGPRSIPRTDFKSRRVIDDRDLFRSLREKLGT